MTQTVALKNKKAAVSQGGFAKKFPKFAKFRQETGLTYFGARYLDPKISRWLSVDPAMYQGDYFPVAPNGDEARKHNQNLPGMGGVFNTINLHTYHYSANNPVKYVDPDGEKILSFSAYYNMSNYTSVLLGNSPYTTSEKNRVTIAKQGCYITTFANIGMTMLLGGYESYTEYGYNRKSSLLHINNLKNIFESENGKLNNTALNTIFGEGRWSKFTKTDNLLAKLKELDASGQNYMIAGVFELTINGEKTNHMVGITGLPDRNGVFAPSSIVQSSDGDRSRLRDSKNKQEYNKNTLVELTVILVD